MPTRTAVFRWFPVLVTALTTATVSLGLFALLLVFAGRSPWATIWSVFHAAFGSSFGIEQTLTRATPLVLCALATALPARAGLFNIGGEGQLHCGAVAATLVALRAGSIPDALVIPAMLIAALLAGGVCALIPAALKTYLDVNEILVALMLNYVAIYLVEYLVHGPWRDESALGWPYTEQFSDAAVLPTWGTTSVHLGLALAVVAAGVGVFVMRKTTWGFAVRVIEANPATARYVGMGLRRAFLVLMVAGGALAALAGAGEVSVIQQRLRPDISPGYGYVGFLVSWLAGHNLVLIVPTALVIGGLYAGTDALQLSAGLPSATADIFMGLVFIAFLMTGHLRQRVRKMVEDRAAERPGGA